MCIFDDLLSPNRNRNKPVMLAGIGGDEWCHVTCGHRHTVLVTTKGDIYACGEGSWGQLGQGEGGALGFKKPMTVKGLTERLDVTEVKCGPNQTGIVTTDGHLYAW